MLGEAKIVFSANLQETLGISWYEGALVGAIPMVPDRLSYSEMALPEFKYPSEWTENYEQFIHHRDDMVKFINTRLDNFADYQDLIKQQQQILIKDYLSSSIMINNLLKKEHSI